MGMCQRQQLLALAGSVSATTTTTTTTTRLSLNSRLTHSPIFTLFPRPSSLTPHAQVVVVDKLDYCANLNNLKSVAGLLNFKFVKGDIGSVSE